MNVNKGLPKGFERHLVAQHFPVDRPIFWGPNQSTKYSGVYNEPSGFRSPEFMKIPKVVRFITGGIGTSPPPPLPPLNIGGLGIHNVSIGRTLILRPDVEFTVDSSGEYVGYTSWRVVHYIGTKAGSGDTAVQNQTGVIDSGTIDGLGHLVGGTAVGAVVKPVGQGANPFSAADPGEGLYAVDVTLVLQISSDGSTWYPLPPTIPMP
jgi:hypothetical protein